MSKSRILFDRLSGATLSRCSRLALALFCMAMLPVTAHAATATTTGLIVSPSTPQAVGTVETLTATVSVSGTATTAPGTVVFCDDIGQATANLGACGFKATLGTAQITSAGTAVLKTRLSPGTHSLYAKFRGTPGAGTPLAASSSFSSAISYTVSVTASTYPIASVIQATGNPGAFSLTDTLVTVPGGATPSATGPVTTFTDTTASTTLGSVSYGATSSSIGLSPAAAYTVPFNSANKGAEAIMTADFTSHGINDIVECANGVGQCVLLTGSSSNPGTFTVGTPFSITPTNVLYGLTADFNNDGYPDFALLTGLTGTARVFVYLNNGNGTFTE